jgi:anaerobic magnesium-protoporphyrin IX monomethyl ester cyclase
MVQSGILTGYGHQVALIDAIALGLTPEQCIDRIAAFSPDAVLALAGDVSWPEDVRFLRRLSAEGLAPRLIVSGDVPRFEPKKTFSELPALEAILTDFTEPGPALHWEGDSHSPGLHHRDGRVTPAVPGRWSSPPARHDLVPMQLYRLPFHGAEPFASVLVNYGCPFACTFCNTGELGYKLRPIDEAIDELRLVHQLGYRRVYIRDATANGRRSHWLAFCQALSAAKLDLKWNVFCTFRPFDAELANAMAAAGCQTVQFGFETASESQRKASGKSFGNEAAYAAVRYAHEAGIKVCGHFVLGLPGQNAEDISNTSAFARELDLDFASFNIAAARPGTHLRLQADQKGLPGGDASAGGFEAGFTDINPAKLRRLRREAIVRFYARPRPIRAVFGNLTQKNGLQQLGQMARALATSF